MMFIRSVHTEDCFRIAVNTNWLTKDWEKKWKENGNAVTEACVAYNFFSYVAVVSDVCVCVYTMVTGIFSFVFNVIARLIFRWQFLRAEMYEI